MHSTSAVSWQPVNLAKRPGELARDSLTHVAHGADAVCFFQWRQSVAGAEKYHSAMLPHAGEDSEVFRSVSELGRKLRDLAPVAGTVRRPALAAIVFDWQSWWASEQDSHPTSLLDYRQEALDWYSAFLDFGVRVDVVPVDTPLDGYDVVIAPVLHVVPAMLSQRLAGYVDGGGHLAVTYFSGIVDENDHVWPGGHPGALRDLLGIRIEEFGPLLDGREVELDNGATGTMWTDRIDITSAEVEVLAWYKSGEHVGRPAITRRVTGTGSATYVSTRLGAAGLRPVLAELLDAAAVHGELPADARSRVELAVRGDHDATFWFLINRTDEPVEVTGLTGDLVVGPDPASEDQLVLPPRAVAVLRRHAD